MQFDDYSRHLFSRDASMYAIMPAGVVFPVDADDVAATVRIAREFGVTVTPRGAGTSLAGQTIGTGIVLDFSRHMHRILDLDPEARTARVQPGVVQDDLNQAAAPFGLMFGPDTSTSNRATIGGMIGNNSAGSGSLRFGMTIDHVQALEVVLSDGSRAVLAPVDEAERERRAAADTLAGRLHRELPLLVERSRSAIEQGFPPFWRRAGGYRLDRLADETPFDLATFLVGSEGTLALVTEAVVGLVPKPKHTAYAIGHFETTQKAIEATADALSCEPAQVELMDKTILDLSRQKIEYADLGRSLVGDPAALLFVSFTGDDQDEVLRQLDALIELWARNGHGYSTLRAVTPAEAGALLKVRKSSLGLLMAASQGSNRPLAFVEDTAVPPARLAEYTARFAEILDENSMTAGFYGHCSVGCLHIRPFVDLSRPDEVARMRTVAVQIKDLVREFGGANSSEHGDGRARSEFNREIFGDELYEAMREVKRLFDPEGRMNPGNIVDAPPMTQDLRDAAMPPAVPFRTRLDFSVVGGMRETADRCMNIGLCRKSTTGAMCPSYVATKMEEHATRGRANALVKALSEADPKAALANERLHEILDLCLMCKACKAECPLGVDMAKLKSETLSHYHDEHGVPLRTRIFGAIRTLNRLGSATAPLSNVPGRIPLLRKAAERTVGIASRRRLPHFERENLVRWFRAVGRDQNASWRTSGPASQGTVNWMADSFTSFTEPHIGRAAIGLLQSAGWDVRSPTPAAAAARRCRRAWSTRRLTRRVRWSAAWRTAPSPARRSSAASRPACSPCATSTCRCSRTTPTSRASPHGCGRWRSCSARRSTTAGWCWPRTRGSPADAWSSTATATRRRRWARPPPSGCCAASRGSSWSSSMPGAAAWQARSATRPSTTRSRWRSAATGCSRRSWPRTATRWWPRPARRAASRSSHGTERHAWHPVELVAEALTSVRDNPGPARR